MSNVACPQEGIPLHMGVLSVSQRVEYLPNNSARGETIQRDSQSDDEILKRGKIIFTITGQIVVRRGRS